MSAGDWTHPSDPGAHGCHRPRRRRRAGWRGREPGGRRPGTQRARRASVAARRGESGGGLGGAWRGRGRGCRGGSGRAAGGRTGGLGRAGRRAGGARRSACVRAPAAAHPRRPECRPARSQPRRQFAGCAALGMGQPANTSQAATAGEGGACLGPPSPAHPRRRRGLARPDPAPTTTPAVNPKNHADTCVCTTPPINPRYHAVTCACTEAGPACGSRTEFAHQGGGRPRTRVGVGVRIEVARGSGAWFLSWRPDSGRGTWIGRRRRGLSGVGGVRDTRILRINYQLFGTDGNKNSSHSSVVVAQL